MNDFRTLCANIATGKHQDLTNFSTSNRISFYLISQKNLLHISGHYLYSDYGFLARNSLTIFVSLRRMLNQIARSDPLLRRLKVSDQSHTFQSGGSARCPNKKELPNERI